MFSWSTAAFDKLLDKATSHLLLEPDWPSIIQICDCIRQGDVQPKYAVSAIKKRLYTRNPHVTLFALQVLESCVKNCGALVHNEIATKPFMEELRDLVKANTNEAVRDKVLELVQAWAHAFRNDPNYRAVQDTLNLMKMEGYKFPYLKESDAMFVADQAPEWADGDCCHRCRVQFSLVQRKHHCRNCGQIFCQKCSSQNAPIPRFGIEKEVRVCEACFEKLSAASKGQPVKVSQKGSGSEQSSPSQTSSAQRRSWQPPSTVQNATTTTTTSPPLSATDAGDKAADKTRRKDLADGDPELARYLNRAYWEQRQQQQQQQDTNAVDGLPSRQSPIPSAPTSAGSPYTVPPKNAEKVDGISGEADSQLEEFVAQSAVHAGGVRQPTAEQRGALEGTWPTDSYVQSLFMSVSNMHSQLLHHLQQQEDFREYYEGLQDKLAQIRDARAALDALRDEHRDQLRREADEAERQRQIQMAQKLHIMRQKKQEYLQYQHQLALQRMQEQERELQMRHELQKQYHHGGAGFPNQPPGLPPPAQGMPPHSVSMPPQQPPPVNMGAPQDHSQMHLPPQLHGGPMPPAPPGQMMSPRGHTIQQGIPPQGQQHVMTTQGHTILPPQGHSVPQPGTPVTAPGQHSVPPQGHQMPPPQGHLSMHSLPPHSAPMSMPSQMPPQQQARPPMHMPVMPPPYRSPTHAATGAPAMPYMMGTAPPHATMMAQTQYGPVSMPAPMGHPMDYQAYSMQQAMSMGMMHGMPHQENPAASPPQHHRPPTSNPSFESATGAPAGAPPVQEAALISFD
ncbi:hepatocyte growth factor-regulated tyrosine kinase substrate-like isoform X3 [Dermacentor silvarum]|uniref:hepatocyte growth factor-regulated tyrosine kinase substrate-like isoform X3 n=1 Tax=Dermacentor silvarum TaxID=543639 RepID=UPI00189A0145|nr:hepatocyte growth factor-regulated tyrosine kinase substrate-like isoform X3 [Dermacentor silvarum]